MTDTRPVLRQWLILRTLSHRRRGASVRELAQEFEVSEKSIRRDLDELRRVGFRLSECVEAHGRKLWSIDRADADDLLSFTLTEVLSLYAARRLLEPLAGTYFWVGVVSAFRKIKAALGETALSYLQHLDGVLHTTAIGSGDYSQQAELIDRLMLGCEEHRITFITYQSLRSTEPVTYEVYPQGIVYHRGSLYLVAFSVSHDEVRHFKVDRTTDADVQTLKFQPDPEFDVPAHLEHTFGVYHKPGRPQRVRIRFAPDVRRHVEESAWHPSQQLTPQPDGSLVAEFRLNSFEEVKAWVLGFGRYAVVEEPNSLRQEICTEIQIMAQRYKRDATPR